MTDKARPLRPPLKTQDLSAQQRSLVDLMREHQFGRVESMSVRAGQPVLNREMTVVRVARLGTNIGNTHFRSAGEFELKVAVRDLFNELRRLQDGIVVRLEFRHGLPFLLETAGPVFAEDRRSNAGRAQHS